MVEEELGMHKVSLKSARGCVTDQGFKTLESVDDLDPSIRVEAAEFPPKTLFKC